MERDLGPRSIFCTHILRESVIVSGIHVTTRDVARPRLSATEHVPRAAGSEDLHADSTLPLNLGSRTLSAELSFSDAEPGRIGRFRIAGLLGVGGMGEVYLCEDAALDRKVAVKRVRGKSSAEAQERLVQEARALAKFSHDNIVQVHEIGHDAGTTFIAMEYVEGPTLRAWLQEGERSWREVCDHFIAAGRGLAAAHARGIVHRDFKPDNVLMRASDGKIKVADFGLVLDEHAQVDATRGVVLGTPRYMSPEQMRGETTDARSDQFSFCLALYWAIWRQTPFTGRTFHERLQQLDANAVQIPRGHRSLFRVVRRGLQVEPAQRWPSMDTLLAALARARHAGRRRRTTALVLASCAAAPLLLLLLRTPATEALICTSGVEGVWDAAARERVEHHLETLDARHVPASGKRLRASLDGWASAWSTLHAQRCEELSGSRDRALEQEGNARGACLLRQRAHVEALVRGVVGGDGKTLAAAVVAAAQLPRPQDCASSLAALGVEPPPQTLVAEVNVLREDIEAVRAQRLLGHIDDARAQGSAIDRVASELSYVPLEAEARAELAKSEDEGGHPLRAAALYDEAIRLAQVSHHDGLAAELLLERVELSLHELRGDPSAALRLELAETAYARIDASEQTRARLLFVAGRLAERSAQLPQARERYEQAVALAGDAALEQPYYLGALAAVTLAEDERLRLRERALELGQQRFGPHHPHTAALLYNHGLELLAAGRDASGRSQLLAAAQLWDESLESSHNLRAKAELHFAASALARGELDVAERGALAASELLDANLPADHPDRAEPEGVLAQVAAMRADADAGQREVLREQAVVRARRAIQLLERGAPGSGPDLQLAGLYQLLGNQLMGLGRLAEAERALERASTMCPRGSQIAALIALRRAELALRRDQLVEAMLSLELVEPQVDALGAEGLVYALLRALVDVRQGRLEEASVARLRAARAAHPELDAALGAWLDELEVTAAERARLEY